MNPTDPRGYSTFIHAVVSGNLDALEVLRNFSDDINKASFLGGSALIVVECGHTEMYSIPN